MKTEKLLALLLSLVLVIGMLPVTALADDTFTYSVASNESGANAFFKGGLADDEDDIDFVQDVGSYTKTFNKSEIEITEPPIGALFRITSYDETNYNFLGWSVNGTNEEGQTDGLGLHFIYIEYGDNVDDLYDTEIVARFENKGTSNNRKPTVVSADNTKLTIEDDALAHVAETETTDTWKLTATCVQGYELRYIQRDDEPNTCYESEDGYTVTWEETTEGAAYTAYFGVAVPHLGDTYTEWQPVGAFYGYPVTLRVPWSKGSTLPQGSRVLYAEAYYLDGDTKVTLGTGSGSQYTGMPGGYTDKTGFTIGIDHFPAGVETFTIAAWFGEDGERSCKTVNVSTLGLKEPGSMALTYLDLPGGGMGQWATLDNGPVVYDVAAFTDKDTGAVTTYFATNSGLVKMAPDGSFETVAGVNGTVVAVGGKSADTLCAVTAAYAGYDEEYHNYHTQFLLWSRDPKTGAWTALTDKQHVTAHGLITALDGWAQFDPTVCVMAADDVWTPDAHWDGAYWTDNDVAFNSFWKDGKGACAGSADGVYAYGSGGWTQLSGTSGKTYVVTGQRSGETVTLLTAGTYDPAKRMYDGTETGGVKKLTVSSGNTTATAIDTGAFVGKNGNRLIGVGLGLDGAVYGFTKGISSGGNDFAEGYSGSSVYKLTSSGWVMQDVDGFNDATDQANIDAGNYPGGSVNKSRPDGVRYTLAPTEGMTYFLGLNGAIYGDFGTSTIRFETNGGSAVVPITQKIFSKVTAPKSPTKEGWSFGGWYRSNLDIVMGNAPYKWTVMPAGGVTLYAKWNEKTTGSSTDPLKTEKAMAKASLAETVERLDESDYSASVWSQIKAEQRAGENAISAAAEYDDIYDALNAAVEKINALAKNVSGEMTVAVTVEKFTVDGKYIVEPTLVTVKKYELASVVVTDLLKAHYPNYSGRPYTMTGNETYSFYLSGVYDSDIGGFLSEFDHGDQSGWMYCVNGSFPGVGASSWPLKNGDVLRWQYTCTGLGADIGNDNTAFGGGSGVTVADKDALIWKIAEINEAGTQSTYGNDYTNAMTVLKTIEAPQADVNAALAALNKQDGGNASTGGTGKKDKTYQITVAATENGTATASASTASEGEKITVTAKPAEGYELDSITVKGEKAGSVEVKDGAFLMPADDVTVTVKFKKAEGKKTTAERPFTDVNEGDWFYDAVYYCFDKGYFKGTSETGFEPQGTMTRAMFATVLWRIAGQPAAKGGKSFSDVEAGQWYTDAVAWASGEGILDGYGGGAFGTNDPVTREQIATMLYRFVQCLGVDVRGSADLSAFPDGGNTSDWAKDAMAWAVSVGLFQGDDTGALNPGGQATRAQVATLVERLVTLLVK